MAIIDRYFGDMTPNNELKHLEITAEKPIVSPVEVTVVGSEAANVNLAWRIGGAASEDMDVLNIINAVLTNGKAGLIDLNLVQQQKVLMAGADIMLFADHGLMLLRGFPKADQTLEQVRDLLLEQLDMLKAGNFDESLLEATINNYKAGIMRLNESNSGRMGMMVDSYINGVDWEREVKLLDRMSRITKEQVVAMANKYFNRNNYVVIYKREGKDENTVKVEKPEITPIITNRDASSEFLKKVRESKVEPIEPVFLDYDRDLAKLKAKSGIEVLYVQNHTNDLYTLEYVFETGTNNDPALAMALDYLQYLGTDKYTAEQIQQEFYRIANSFRLSAGEQRTTISINGINENIEQAITLLEDLLANAKPDEEVLANYKADLAKSRSDQKLNQMTNFRRMRSYAQYGPKSPATNVLSNEELEAITSEELLARIRKFADMQHRIIYYGPMSGKQIVKTIDRFHHVPAKLTPAPAQVVFKPLETKENKILLSHYDAKQIYYSQYSGRGEMFQPSIDPQVRLYNDYFGGSMNAIVFQEMREARGLAYTAQAGLLTPARKEIPYAMTALIMTQNDKMVDAAAAFMEIIDNMPESQQRLDIAKESIMTNIRTQRIIKENIIRNYMAALDLGINYDRRRSIFETIPSLTIDDVKDFQLKWVKGRKYTYTILGNESELDMKSMEEKYGPVQRVSQEELFGY